MKRAKVLIEFADKDDFSRKYKVGEELKGFDEQRIKSLVRRGIAGYDNDDTSDIDMSDNYQSIVAQVATFEDVAKLKLYLESENAREKSRTSVVEAIEQRLKNLVGDE